MEEEPGVFNCDRSTSFMQFDTSLALAKQLDTADKLPGLSDEFIIPSLNGQQQIYFLGNSLGLQPKRTKPEIEKVLGQWADYGVEAFFTGKEPWLDYHDRLVKPLSVIVGAKPSEICVMNQLTVNLHLMLVSFYRPQGKRKKILCEAKAFPSDQYMLETHIRHHGYDPAECIVEVTPRDGKQHILQEDIIAAIEDEKDELALVLFSGVNYYSGQVFDIRAITNAAHGFGIRVGFDLAHAAGNIDLELHNWDVDFACWCHYKYLNAGPGAIGGVYIHERFHKDHSLHRFAGWWGYHKATRFKMDKGFVPIESAEGWQLSTPSLLLYASLKASLDVFEKAGWERLRQKQKLLTSYLWFLLDELQRGADKKNLEFITPRNENERGCQVSLLMNEHGKEVFDELTRNAVMVDWREPNVIRLAPVPLYNRFEEVWRFANILREILISKQ
jgi:kynureninase